MRHIVPLLAAIAVLSPIARAGTPAVSETLGQLRREPVLPTSLPDYELVALEGVQKQVVFHIGEQTVVGNIPVLAYVPVTRAGRAAAVDHLIEARTLLVKVSASASVTTSDLAALRDLLERSISELRADNVQVAAAAGGAPSSQDATKK